MCYIYIYSVLQFYCNVKNIFLQYSIYKIWYTNMWAAPPSRDSPTPQENGLIRKKRYKKSKLKIYIKLKNIYIFIIFIQFYKKKLQFFF